MKKVALIPARSGSKRIPNKNILDLAGNPMLAYSIRAAIESKIFDAVICVTDSAEYADIAVKYGAEVPKLRPSNISGDTSPDVEWVTWIIGELSNLNRNFEIFSILRPTSPFRLSGTIKRAWALFQENLNADSLRAVEKCSQHPGKMWMVRNNRMLPILPFCNGSTPWHSSQYAALPEVYVQNASLEIAWTRLINEGNTISGESIVPFITKDLEGFDINSTEDFYLAQYYISHNIAKLESM